MASTSGRRGGPARSDLLTSAESDVLERVRQGRSGVRIFGLYFQVPEMDAAHKALQAKGVEFPAAPHMIFRHDDGTEEWLAFFADPVGNTLALMSQPRAG